MTEDAALAHRRAAANQRLQAYDYAVAALVPYLVALAGRMAKGEVTEDDLIRVEREVEVLRRCLSPGVPAYPVETP